MLQKNKRDTTELGTLPPTFRRYRYPGLRTIWAPSAAPARGSFIADDPGHGGNRTRGEEAVRTGQPTG